MVLENDIRYGRRFGGGEVFGQPGNELSKMTAEIRVRAMGWSHACPVVDDVMREFRPEWTLRRYTECNFVHSQILERASVLNRDLYKQLTTPTKRYKGELPDSTIDRSHVPTSFETEMSPMSHPTGYSISRMILVAARDEQGNGVKDKVSKIKLMLNKEIVDAKDPIQLTLKIAQRLAEQGADKQRLIYHLMSAGVLSEEGCKTIFKEILHRMPDEAPSIYNEYITMTEHAALMKTEGIITPGQLK